MVYSFIRQKDALADLINEKANILFDKLRRVDVLNSRLDEFGKLYFSNHHTGNRLYFSLESSAAIIYASVRQLGKPLADTSFTDYGAGLGTLFLLAGMVGFKEVYFNDLFPVWETNARVLCEELDIPVTAFIMGDVESFIAYGKKHQLHFDIIASRNVLEHIYQLRDFFATLYSSGLTSMCYSTTTANYHNPAMLVKHWLYHRKVEKQQYRKQRGEKIKAMIPGLDEKKTKDLVEITRGRAFGDFDEAVATYLSGGSPAPVEFLGTNTCDCETGVWAEHIIRRSAYADIIGRAGFQMTFTAGFWDTHYRFTPLNWITSIFNKLIMLSGKRAYIIAPFVNIVAYSIENERKK